MRTFAIGDIHGAYRALVQCLDRSGFDKDNDRLIVLGDLVDGWSESIEVINELSSIKDLVYVIGNHDRWFIDYLNYGATPDIWTSQGGASTLDSVVRFIGDGGDINDIISFFNKGVYYYEDKGRLFVHGGFDWHNPIEQQSPRDLIWDRHMWETARYWHLRKTGHTIKQYNEVFIGHTATYRIAPGLEPVNFANVWNLDQGAGWGGKLTIMDVDSHQYWQSDMVWDLYPDEKGRRQ